MNDKELLFSKKIWLKRKKYEKFLFHSNEASYIYAFSILNDNNRREILKYIGKEIKTIEDIKNFFNFNIYELKIHLSLLEYALFIKKVNTGWRITSRGNALLKSIEE